MFISSDAIADDHPPSFPVEPSNIRFEHNIVVDFTTAYSSQNGISNVGTYYSNAMYFIMRDTLVMDNNCYYNPNTALQFDFASAKSFGDEGGVYSFFQWKALGFDTSSIDADPQFIDAASENFQMPVSSPCKNKGADAVY